ncbi:hypothetical protein [Cyanophage S-TIM5]|uniref:Virion structural protein n=1 Tax=Cyanophage S-TIM5 TaxID=1137745 RepID=H6WG40_9CAUD|nr:hypothetical protein F417_gp007 [Cyanophage S-TIM5]AEZ65586.1 hypothetical protein [Cyanophage S-TIM5]UYE96750.1 hypothetical protein [Cyanophage S-TIM66]UYE96963.1 hypothetical protein [Cyanophage S-TIM61]
MSIYPVNKFKSSIHPAISISASSPTVIWDDAEVDGVNSYGLVTSLICSNKTSTPRKYSLILEKNTTSGTNSAFLLYEVTIPANTAFEVIQGNKFVLKDGDRLKAYSDAVAGTTAGVVDVTISYVVHIPPSA